MNYKKSVRVAELAGAVALATFLSVSITNRIRVEPAARVANTPQSLLPEEELACFDPAPSEFLASHYHGVAEICGR